MKLIHPVPCLAQLIEPSAEGFLEHKNVFAPFGPNRNSLTLHPTFAGYAGSRTSHPVDWGWDDN